ncbi:ATP-binding protein [Ferrimonas aestuarii]|uniref:histidine kinase n=1 Tax=Ferrimonas aestuarii TaxID=2569539 RepID=A0A4U1BTL7_9GAMM|nr:transporter substrate-binding domain-containing protein [Ferrimonas aestuarii]TKB58700.1 transporter substrate-binding domain-containing protein [Ferrimonas aestuarii]
MKYLSLLLLVFPLISAAKETLIFGVHSNTAPLEWRDKGVDQGFNVELLNEIGKLTDMEIRVRRKSFQTLVHEIGRADRGIDVIAVVSPVGINRDAQQSDPIYATHAKAYTLKGHGFIDNWHDLEGKRVAIKVGSFVDVYLQGHPQKFIRKNVDLYETGFQQLARDEVDVVLAENFVARRLQPHYPYVRSASDPLIFGTFNFVSHKTDVQLMDRINSALRQMKLSGSYDLLVNKWFGTGREKVDLLSTQRTVMWWAIVVAMMSILGMFYTWNVSQRLHRRTVELDTELEQRRRTEQWLSQVSDQFQSVLDGLPHGVYLFDGNLNRLWSNGKYLELFDSNELLNAQKRQIDLHKLVERHQRKEQSGVYELHIQQRYYQMQVNPISQGHAVVTLEDITEQHQLRQANEQASRLASLGELSAGVAHEINNPTGLIIHASALFEQAIIDLTPAIALYSKHDPFWQIAGLSPERAQDEMSHASEVIDDAAGRIGRIVKDLKQYAQEEPCQNNQAINLNEVVQVALRLTTNQHKRFEVNLDLLPELANIEGDPGQLHQVLVNLIQNACHAMESVQGQLRIRTEQDANQVSLMVSDNGCGMDSATLDRVKEPFFTTRRRQGGTGLGLSVCNRIINQHRGSWQLQSVPNIGTQVTLRFPKVTHS